VEYYNIPILSDEEQQSMNYMPDYTFIMGDFYTSMMQKSQEALCEIFKKMADADGKVFFHCSAGKDRTGIVSAILLKLADVDNDAIIYDYCLTEKFLRNKLQSLKDNVLLTQPISSEIVDELMGAKANNMEKVLSYIEHNYSDVSTYLMSIGLSQSEIIQLKFKMISGERRI
jgi:protein-tyrosine phosphatase